MQQLHEPLLSSCYKQLLKSSKGDLRVYEQYTCPILPHHQPAKNTQFAIRAVLQRLWPATRGMHAQAAAVMPASWHRASLSDCPCRHGSCSHRTGDPQMTRCNHYLPAQGNICAKLAESPVCTGLGTGPLGGTFAPRARA